MTRTPLFLLASLLLTLVGCEPIEVVRDIDVTVDDDDDDSATDPVEPPGPAIDADRDGYSTLLDCDDSDPTVYPDAPELCDGIDNNCGGAIDEGLPTEVYYVDADRDGFGRGEPIELCADPGESYSQVDGDCNDADAAFHPGAEDIGGDGYDTDCDDETQPDDVWLIKAE